MPLRFLKRPVLLALSLASSTGPGCAEESESAISITEAAITVDTTATYQLVGTQSGKCVDVPNGSSTLGLQLDIATCGTSTSQRFKLDSQGNGNYHVRNVGNGLCMDVKSAALTDGAAVVQWTCGTGTNQQWSFTDSAGAEKVTALHSGKVLDVTARGTADGTKLEQWTWGGGTNQLFKLQVVNTGSVVGTFSGPLATGIVFLDQTGTRVNAHGGGIIQVGDTFYLHGEYFPPATTTNGNFNGFTMYSSKNLSTWTYERMILPQQPSGELGPNRKGERPHIIKCPSSGEYVLYAHAADVTYQADKEVVYATSPTVNGVYTYRGPLKNASGQLAVHSDMSAYADNTGAYVLTESGHVYTLATDCHSWLSDKSMAVNGDSGGAESPTVFRAGGTYYWIGSYKTGWRANNNFYSTAPAITGPWTYQGYLAPVTNTADHISDQRTWLSQSTWVQPVTGGQGTVYVYWGDHWSGNQDTTAPGQHNDQAGYVFQPLVFTGTKIGLPTYHATWTLDVGAGTWTP